MRRLAGDCPGDLMASRLRLQRILCVLKHHGLNAAARKMEMETGVFFDATYMERLMRMGSWDKADSYLLHFLPTAEHWSPQSTALVIHLRSAWTLAAADFTSHFDEFKAPAASKFCDVFHEMHADEPKASKLWKNVVPSAVITALSMIADCPESKGKLHLPRDTPMPWEAIPLIGARRSPRRHSKPAYRAPLNVVVRAFKRQKRWCTTKEVVHTETLFLKFANFSNTYIPCYSTRNLLSTLESDAYSVFPSNASSFVALDTKTEQNAPKPITLEEQQKENKGIVLNPEKQDAPELCSRHMIEACLGTARET